MDESGKQTEFSWRTMTDMQSDAIVYSGDETSGYNGGSEYFDINIVRFKMLYPDLRYIIFCNNVFSDLTFDNCICRAGYMLRDENDSGQVFKPKTVKSSFKVSAPTHFCYLFAIDLDKNEFVWLNCAKDSNAKVAGSTPLGFLLDYIKVTEVINVYDFFEMAATEITTDIRKADIIVTDKELLGKSDDITGKIIREYDIERIMSLMNSL